ncbi:hypothetical protein BDW22DRAFT_1362590 [Trametopsis cervina]|nr:hypothetical protein BDW22DRAFT_1362590 [Trametopsis cervina]
MSVTGNWNNGHAGSHSIVFAAHKPSRLIGNLGASTLAPGDHDENGTDYLDDSATANDLVPSAPSVSMDPLETGLLAGMGAASAGMESLTKDASVMDGSKGRISSKSGCILNNRCMWSGEDQSQDFYRTNASLPAGAEIIEAQGDHVGIDTDHVGLRCKR